MELHKLIEGCKIEETTGLMDVEVSDITSDSRKVKPGCAFIAIEGINTDGHDYISKAIELGASVVIYDKRLIEEFYSRVTYVRVQNSIESLGKIASNWFNKPSSELKLIGVTGTNGKTTVATLLHNLFRRLGYAVGLLSTVSNYINDDSYPTSHTTMDVISINEYLRKMVDAGCQYVFMEVSSHAIHQQRIGSLFFEGAVFTNLSQDHLDYHKNMLEYRNVKKQFFDSPYIKSFVLTNVDDKNGLFMVQNSIKEKYTYSVKGMADFKGRIIEKHLDGTNIEINGREIFIRFVGSFNVYNLLAVYGTAILLKQSAEEVLQALSILTPVAGRFQTLRSPDNFTVIIDYAHTPDALSNVLVAIHDVLQQNGNVITVIGCGGNRDQTKRPLMAQEAVLRSNRAIFTSDNPRFEDPQEILNQMMDGLNSMQKKSVLSIIDRQEAIKTACALAQPGDVVLIAGKGHEDYQEIKGVKYHFDDKEIVENIFIN